jgi:AcrR family transcriptional regulator
LYRHFDSKSALLDAMVEHISTSDHTPPVHGEWPEQLRAAARGARAAMLTRRDGARLLTTFQKPGPAAILAWQRLVDALVAGGASAEGAMAGVDTVFAYVNGFTMEEQARGGRPAAERDRQFAAGLELIVTGIAGTLSAERRRPQQPS